MAANVMLWPKIAVAGDDMDSVAWFAFATAKVRVTGAAAVKFRFPV
jgi:hypothetical protein